MRPSLAVFVLLVFIASPAESTLQDQINAVASTGGEVKLPCGLFQGTTVVMPSNVALVGSGPCTVVPSISTQATPAARKYGIRIENLTIDGSIDGNQYIGVDLRNTSVSRVRNVSVRNVQYGVLLYQSSFYNSLEDLVIDATVQCFQIIDGANENTVRGGRCQHASAQKIGTGAWMRNVNSVKIFGTSFENLNVGISVDEGTEGASIFSPRLENMNCGIQISLNSSRTSIFHIYASNIVPAVPICSTPGNLADAQKYYYSGSPY